MTISYRCGAAPSAPCRPRCAGRRRPARLGRGPEPGARHRHRHPVVVIVAGREQFLVQMAIGMSRAMARSLAAVRTRPSAAYTSTGWRNMARYWWPEPSSYGLPVISGPDAGSRALAAFVPGWPASGHVRSSAWRLSVPWTGGAAASTYDVCPGRGGPGRVAGAVPADGERIHQMEPPAAYVAHFDRAQRRESIAAVVRHLDPDAMRPPA
jgi:hypothetical protein